MFSFISLLQKIKSLKLDQWQILVGPILILIILSMMVLPLPSFLLDVCFTFNISLSIVILLVAMFTRRTLEFTAFPTILLFSTLLRLALNVASTRIILLEGHTGSSSAGYVIESFGHFLVGGNFAIGTIVFIILVVINFMVITKGAGRIAEVGARFILDGMPGKQMAIDADLNAGLIGEKSAKLRRQEISQEADFYGSMDGASKFVRGDAIAGILIMIINIVGGLIVAIGQHHMLLAEAAKVYTILTIGDGLVAQIPALVISTASGVIVTRVSTDQNVGEQMISQLFFDYRVLFLSAVVLGILGLVPGMPNMIFLLFTVVLLFISWRLYVQNEHLSITEPVIQQDHLKKNIEVSKEPTWNDVDIEDVISIELGESLLPMIDLDVNDDLKNRIRGIRKQFAKEIGFLPPRIHIYYNSNLDSTHYKILLKGIELDFGEVFLNQYMAINPGGLEIVLSNKVVKDPTFKLLSYWIDVSLVEQAKKYGFTVVTPSVIIATHVHHLMFKHVHDLFGREEVQYLVDHITKEMPKLMENFIPNTISITVFYKILYNLLLEHVPIRNIRIIVENLLEQHSDIKDQLNKLTSIVRIALGKIITQKFFPKELNSIQVIGLDNSLEQILLQLLQSGEGSMEPGLSDRLLSQTHAAIVQQRQLKKPIILLVQHPLRYFLSCYLRRTFPELVVLSHMEIIDDRKIFFSSIIGQERS
ncbi:MAG: flagellar biosynthesis protein FlhA [Buchnera aphidicola (Eriosoma harunire)]